MTDVKVLENNEADSFLKYFLNRALKEIMSVIHAECGSLFLFDTEHQELILNAFYDSKELHIKGLKHRIGEGVSGKVADIKLPVLVKDINSDSRFRNNGFKHYRTNSFVSIPLFSMNRLLGLINLADKANGEPFSDEDLNVAVTVAKYACVALDGLTGLKQEKDSLDKQKALLEKYATVGKLAGGIVHEINNPLDGVIRYTNMVLNQLDNNTVAHEYLLEVKKGLNRIANITKSLLEFSHQVNSSPKNKKYINAHDLINESLDVFKDRIDGHVTVVRNYKSGMPKILDLGLSHVVINIIENALDAMGTGGKLEINTNVNDMYVEFNFKDTGPGIPNEIKERIFEPFFTTKTMEKGTGLGLAICKEVVNKYEGKINARGHENKGSIFTIMIPKRFLEGNG
ncbi:MAG: ATP-binding protein [Candidatus Omnitrophica bacterium]|nr:ATP-binding protein [Candidatus Omnitrophota bacterium]